MSHKLTDGALPEGTQRARTSREKVASVVHHLAFALLA